MENAKIDEQDGGRGADDNNEDDKEELEAKIDKFFSLIKSYRDARNRLMIREEYSEEKEKEKEKEKKTKRMKLTEGGGGWAPSFESEDFIKEIKFRTPDPLILPTPRPCDNTNNKEIITEYKQVDTNGLDLNLTL